MKNLNHNEIWSEIKGKFNYIVRIYSIERISLLCSNTEILWYLGIDRSTDRGHIWYNTLPSPSNHYGAQFRPALPRSAPPIHKFKTHILYTMATKHQFLYHTIACCSAAVCVYLCVMRRCQFYFYRLQLYPHKHFTIPVDQMYNVWMITFFSCLLYLNGCVYFFFLSSQSFNIFVCTIIILCIVWLGLSKRPFHQSS